LSIHFCRSSRRIRFGIGMRRRRSRMKGRNNNDKQFPVIPRQTKDSPAEELGNGKEQDAGHLSWLWAASF